jgi:hypothetical protein
MVDTVGVTVGASVGVSVGCMIVTVGNSLCLLGTSNKNEDESWEKVSDVFHDKSVVS